MKQVARTFLIFGLCIIATSLAIAATSLENTPGQEQTSLETTACLFCRVDPHLTWNVIAVPAPQSGLTPQTNSPGTQCSDCHAMETVNDLPDNDTRNQLITNQERITWLRSELNHIQTQHPEWQHNITRSQKSETQILAEQVEVIISVLEADGSWGFHDLDYTDMQLAEAEQLFVTLQVALNS